MSDNVDMGRISKVGEQLAALRVTAQEQLSAMSRIYAKTEQLGKDAETLLQTQLSKNEIRFNEAFGLVGKIKGSAIATALINSCNAKAIWEWGLVVFYFLLFVAGLATMAALAILAARGSQIASIALAWKSHGAAITLSDRLLSVLPLYVPLIWFEFFVCHRLGLSRRVAEAYSHKVVMGKVYVGLMSAVDDIRQNGDVQNSDRLRAELMAALIRIYERSPSEDMKNVKAHTPLNETADAVSRILSAIPSKAADLNVR